MTNVYEVKTNPNVTEIALAGQRILLALDIILPPNYRQLESIILGRAKENPSVEVGGWVATDGRSRIQELYCSLGDRKSLCMPTPDSGYLLSLYRSGLSNLVEYHSHTSGTLEQSPEDKESMIAIQWNIIQFLIETGYESAIFSVLCSPNGSLRWIEGFKPIAFNPTIQKVH